MSSAGRGLCPVGSHDRVQAAMQHTDDLHGVVEHAVHDGVVEPVEHGPAALAAESLIHGGMVADADGQPVEFLDEGHREIEDLRLPVVEKPVA